MKIIKVNTIFSKDFESNNQFIPLESGNEFNYYLVDDYMLGYEQVNSTPTLNNIVLGEFGSIVKYVSYLSNEKIKEEILDLESSLNKTDYKVLKSYEYSLVGKVTPYNTMDLHQQRQLIRDRINLLQNQIKDEKTWNELSNIIINNRKNI